MTFNYPRRQSEVMKTTVALSTQEVQTPTEYRTTVPWPRLEEESRGVNVSTTPGAMSFNTADTNWATERQAGGICD